MKRPFDVAGLVLTLIAFAVAAVMEPGLPDPMPSHWNVHGQVDGWMPKPWGAFIFPLVMTALWLIFLALPRISPHGFEMAPFARAWGYLRLAILGFVFLVGLLAFQAAKTREPLSSRLLLAALGVLFAVIGNFLGKVTRNFFVGIRTPWTLASEEVWYRTHRLAGKLFVAAGFLVAATSLPGLGIWPIFPSVGLATIVPVVYSFLIYKKLEGLPTPGSSN